MRAVSFIALATGIVAALPISSLGAQAAAPAPAAGESPTKPAAAPLDKGEGRAVADKLAGDLGTATCEHVMRQTKKGEWEWSRACYCSDASKNADPSNPLANITRCEASWEK